MKAAALLLSVAVAHAGSAPSTIAHKVDSVVTRAGFSGEVAVVRRGHLTFARGYGLADRARGRRVTLDTSFNLASMGKMFTGVAAAQLVEAGKLRFGDPVGKYVSGLPRRLRAITVAELLDHTSGLGDVFSDPGYPRLRRSLTTLASYLPLVSHERLQFAPGARWSYSNSGFVLAGIVIEKASGARYADYLAGHIWKPAGMTHTGCFLRTRLPRFAAVGYLHRGATNTVSLPPVGTSAGGCYSSARDLLSFATALESGRLLNRAMTAIVTSSKVKAPGGGYGYGFGIRNGRPGDPPTIWHNGGAPGAAGELDINPKLGIVTVVLGNVSPPQVFPVVDTLLNALRVP